MTSQPSRWLTLLHGFSQNRRIFSRQREYFSSQYRIFAPELKGHGARSSDTGPFGLQEYADDVMRQLESSNVTHTHFWGTHTGAAVGRLAPSQRLWESMQHYGIGMPPGHGLK